MGVMVAIVHCVRVCLSVSLNKLSLAQAKDSAEFELGYMFAFTVPRYCNHPIHPKCSLRPLRVGPQQNITETKCFWFLGIFVLYSMTTGHSGARRHRRQYCFWIATTTTIVLVILAWPSLSSSSFWQTLGKYWHNGSFVSFRARVRSFAS